MTRTQLTRAAIMLFAVATAPVGAATDLSLPRIEALSIEGGGKVVVRHGPQQRVRILRGNAQVSSFQVKQRRSLEIMTCRGGCPADYELEVEVTLPEVSALAVERGGAMTVTGFPAQEDLAVAVSRGGKVTLSGFAGQRDLALAVSGGGIIDADAVQTRQVAAAVDGGGIIRTWPSASLAASIDGGGNITYRGAPSITTSVRGGGRVTRAD